MLRALWCIAVAETTVDGCEPLVDAATDAGLTTLLPALDAADLVNAVTAEGTAQTIFAPSNEAFATALDALGLTLEDLIGNTELLTEILLYHILPNPFTTADFSSSGTFETLLGDGSSCGVDTVEVVSGDSVTIVGGTSNATVLIADVETCSGVLHVIDFVLLPCPVPEPATEPPFTGIGRVL